MKIYTSKIFIKYNELYNMLYLGIAFRTYPTFSSVVVSDNDIQG